jgi:nitroreductase
MTAEEAIRARRSVRGFLPKPVPPEVMREVFELAQWAPSNCNIQPWQVFVASGATRDRLREKFIRNITGGVPPNPDYAYPGKFEGVYRDRQVDCAVRMYNEMGIERDDKVGRMKASLRNFELFDAPHVCFIGMDERFGETVAIDVGMYFQTLMLAMTSRGISSCAQGSMRYYPDLVREAFDAPANVKILAGISFGYEDPEVPANRTRMVRAPLEENVTFCD